MIFLLEKIRKIFKSFGKKEENINDIIIYKKFKNNLNRYRSNNQIFNPELKSKKPTNIVATIAFFFEKKRINNLNKICEQLNNISKFNKIYILTNKISAKELGLLKKKIKVKVNFIIIKEILHNRLLPWYHYDLMKKSFKQKKITHFIYLEDDMLINKKNFDYWVNSRKFLKQFNLIPGFVRIEKNKSDNNLYSVDYVKRVKLNSLPRIQTNEKINFINNKYPYQGMYLYDRDLMKEHLNGPSSNPDCGHGAYNTDYIDKRMINLDLMAKANIGLTYINVPKGFFNRIVIPFNLEKKQIDDMCFIQHLSNKYVYKKSWFSNFKINDVIL